MEQSDPKHTQDGQTKSLENHAIASSLGFAVITALVLLSAVALLGLYLCLLPCGLVKAPERRKITIVVVLDSMEALSGGSISVGSEDVESVDEEVEMQDEKGDMPSWTIG
jgi:hypothetical protein